MMTAPDQVPAAALRALVVMPLARHRGGAEIVLSDLLSFGSRFGVDWLAVFLEPGPLVDEAAKHVATAVVPKQAG